MAELREPGDAVAGEKLVAWGRKIGRIFIIPGTGAHRAHSVYMWGRPARCRIDIPLRHLEPETT